MGRVGVWQRYKQAIRLAKGLVSFCAIENCAYSIAGQSKDKFEPVVQVPAGQCDCPSCSGCFADCAQPATGLNNPYRPPGSEPSPRRPDGVAQLGTHLSSTQTRIMIHENEMLKLSFGRRPNHCLGKTSMDASSRNLYWGGLGILRGSSATREAKASRAPRHALATFVLPDV